MKCEDRAPIQEFELYIYIAGLNIRVLFIFVCLSLYSPDCSSAPIYIQTNTHTHRNSVRAGQQPWAGEFAAFWT